MINIKTYKQTKGYCGPSSLRMVLKKYGIDKSEIEIARLVRASRKYGCSDKSILNAAKKLGLRGFIKKYSNFKEVDRLMRKKIPVIVNWYSEKTGGHYSVVIGLNKRNVVIADPHHGGIMKYDKLWFKERWFDVVNDKLILREIIVVMSSNVIQK